MLNVHNAGGFSLLDHLGYELDHYGTVDPADLIARIDDAAPTISDDYLAARGTAHSIGRYGRCFLYGYDEWRWKAMIIELPEPGGGR